MANPALLVSSFNNSLTLTDANGAGTWTGVDPVRYDDVGAQNGLWVEQATTNIVVNPSFETNTTGWGADRGTLTQSDEQAYSGTYSAKLVVTSTGTVVGININPLTVPAHNQTHTFRYMVYNAGAAQRTGYFRVAGVNGTGVALPVGEWTEVSRTTTVANLSAVVCNVPDAAVDDVFYFDAVQIENVGYATSYCDGSLGTGYSWTGTAHASTSTRAASSISVDQDTVARINPSSGSIAFRYKRLIDTGAEEIILTSGVAGSGTDYLEIGVDANDDLYMEWNSDNAGAERVTITTTIATDTDYFFYFDWDSTAIRASIDNGTLSSDTRAAAEGDWSTGDLTISAAVGSHVVGPFAVFDRPLTTKEITYLDTHSTWSFGMLPLGSRANIFQLRPKAVT